MERTSAQGRGRWIFNKANWAKFEEICERRSEVIDSTQEINNLNDNICAILLEAVSETIPKSKGKMTRKVAAWWTDECG